MVNGIFLFLFFVIKDYPRCFELSNFQTLFGTVDYFRNIHTRNVLSVVLSTLIITTNAAFTSNFSISSKNVNLFEVWIVVP